MRLTCVLLLLAFNCQQTSAASLQELLNKARTTEPAYMLARANSNVAKAKREQTLGALLPQISISAGTNENARDYKTRNPNVPQASDEYGSEYFSINLTQAIINPASLHAFRQSNTVLQQAEMELRAAEQTLILNLTTAWFDWLAAIDIQNLANQKLTVALRELSLVQRGYELGSHSYTELGKFRARSAQAKAEADTSQAGVSLKKAELERLAGDFEPVLLPHLNEDDASPVQFERSLTEVLNELETANPQFLASQQALLAASQEIKKQNSGHAPTLDWVVSHGKNSQAVGGFPGQSGYDITTTSSGLKFNWPLFSGGTQQGKVNEAIAMRDKASAELLGALNRAKLDAKQAWYGLASARSKTTASQQNKLAAFGAYQHALRSAELGLHSELDVLKARQDMITAENEFNKSRYEQLIAWVRLKASGGFLNESDVRMLDKLITYQPREHANSSH